VIRAFFFSGIRINERSVIVRPVVAVAFACTFSLVSHTPASSGRRPAQEHASIVFAPHRCGNAPSPCPASMQTRKRRITLAHRYNFHHIAIAVAFAQHVDLMPIINHRAMELTWPKAISRTGA
jgi:hypothetical protein